MLEQTSLDQSQVLTASGKARLGLVYWLGASMVVLAAGAEVAGDDAGLLAHWPLTRDCRDASGHGRHGVGRGVTFHPDGGAAFDGVGSVIEAPAVGFDGAEWTVALRLHTAASFDDVPGDILSCWDPVARNGLHLSLLSSVGCTTAQANWRNLCLGIEPGGPSGNWADCGRPGNSRMVWALAVHDGALYAGTWEPGAGEAGHVYRYAGGQQWADCGVPDGSNAVSTLAEFDGALYAGTSFYSGEGSALPPSPNGTPGGRVFRYAGDKRWVDCGRIGDVWTATGLVVFRGQLYATTCDSYGCPKRTAACYRYDGGQAWTWVGDPGGRVGAFIVHNGQLCATTFGKLGFARYDGGTQWTGLGLPPGVEQTYSAAVYRGRVCVGTWPNGEVFRVDGPNAFASLGRVGSEKEVMAMAVYNGRLYGGTLPLGEVHRYEGKGAWVRTGQLDATPDVKYRRVWSMAVFQGKLFAGTLPSGRVLALESGACVTHDRALAPGWQHVAAAKTASELRLYVDGRRVATSVRLTAESARWRGGGKLNIGGGETDFFKGSLRDLRVYGRALTDAEIRGLAASR